VTKVEQTASTSGTPGSGSSSQGDAGSGGHPALNSPVTRPANPPPEFYGRAQPAAPDRTRGYRPDARQEQQLSGEQQADHSQSQQQQPAAQESVFRLGDGVEISEKDVRAALAQKVENEVRRAALPASPDKYEIKLPSDFRAPEGVRFEFDPNDALLKSSRELAHKRGLDQEAYSDFLGLYAANRITEQQQLGTARAAELSKLGTAAQGRIDAIDTWLKARVGAKGALMAAQLRSYPVAVMVEMYEDLIRQFSGQGGADFRQDGRQQQDNTGGIPGYENMNFSQRRAAQDAAAARGRGR
jgi:hypothetical protein